MICPVCEYDAESPLSLTLHIERAHPARERVNRGRRFFLVGALALPVARKLESLAPIVAPPAPRLVLKNYTWRVIYPYDAALPVDQVKANVHGWYLAT